MLAGRGHSCRQRLLLQRQRHGPSHRNLQGMPRARCELLPARIDEYDDSLGMSQSGSQIERCGLGFHPLLDCARTPDGQLVADPVHETPVTIATTDTECRSYGPLERCGQRSSGQGRTQELEVRLGCIGDQDQCIDRAERSLQSAGALDEPRRHGLATGLPKTAAERRLEPFLGIEVEHEIDL